MTIEDKNRDHQNLAPTPYEYALMSAAAYEKMEHVEERMKLTALGWEKLIIEQELNPYHYRGVAYKHESRKQIVIAHRGTNFKLLTNLVSDLSIWLRGIPESHQYARNFSEMVRASDIHKEYTITETGHSLGAVHAEINSQLFDNCDVFTFDSPGTMEMLQGMIRNTNNVTQFLSAPNFINTANEHFPNMIRVYMHHVNPDDENFLAYQKFITSDWRLLAKSILITCLEQFFSYDFHLHSIRNLAHVFDPNIGEPTLQRRVHHWPTQQQFLSAKLNPVNYDPITYIQENLRIGKNYIHLNQRYEEWVENINGYSVGNYIFPTFHEQDRMLNANVFKLSALNRYSNFFTDNNIYKTIEQNLIKKILVIPFEQELQRQQQVTHSQDTNNLMQSLLRNSFLQNNNVVIPNVRTLDDEWDDILQTSCSSPDVRQ